MSDKKLFSEFTSPSRQDWLDKIQVDLKGADFQKKLVWKTDEGFSVQPFYMKEDLEKLSTIGSEPGVISMARTKDPDSAGSQFFIMVASASHLDGDYASFGKVIEGMDVVEKIVSVERDRNDKPLEDQKMKKVEVDTKGFDYPEPIILK